MCNSMLSYLSGCVKCDRRYMYMRGTEQWKCLFIFMYVCFIFSSYVSSFVCLAFYRQCLIYITSHLKTEPALVSLISLTVWFNSAGQKINKSNLWFRKKKKKFTHAYKPPDTVSTVKPQRDCNAFAFISLKLEYFACLLSAAMHRFDW